MAEIRNGTILSAHAGGAAGIRLSGPGGNPVASFRFAAGEVVIARGSPDPTGLVEVERQAPHAGERAAADASEWDAVLQMAAPPAASAPAALGSSGPALVFVALAVAAVLILLYAAKDDDERPARRRNPGGCCS